MEKVPAFVSVVFMLTTFVTVGIFIYAVRSIREHPPWAKLILFLVPFWLIFQFVLASSGFYLDTNSLPPRLFFYGLAPAIVLIILTFIFARNSFAAVLPLALLTIVHVIRIPVELTISCLASAGAVPEIMTFHGTNFDIFSGLTAPFALYFAFQKTEISKYVLIGWNLCALALVSNIVITAILCIPSPLQKLAFDQPNIAVLYSPYIWLPTVIVPIVFFSHLASLHQLLFRRTR